MTVDALVRELRAQGVRLTLDGDRVRVRGPVRLLTPEVSAVLSAEKPALLRLLRSEAAEIAIRVATMRDQLAAATSAGRPIPFLTVRPALVSPSTCLSCGDPIGRLSGIRCVPCAEAARLVIDAMRPEGVPS